MSLPSQSLRRATVPSPVMRNGAKSSLAKKQHLRVPVVRSQWPPVTENNRLALAQVFVEDPGAIFGRNRRHEVVSLFVSPRRELFAFIILYQSSKLLAPPFILFFTRFVQTNLITRASL